MTNLELMHYFLGIEVWKDDGNILISQRKYTLDLLQRFKMSECKSLTTLAKVRIKLSNDEFAPMDPTLYRQLISNLIYLASIRPDIIHAISMVS